jgi:hypothetical protein
LINNTFSEQTDLFKKTAVKWKSIANRDNGTRFAIEEDSEGNIWFGDRDTETWKYDGKSVTNYTINNKLSTQMIWSMYKDNNNNLLLEWRKVEFIILTENLLIKSFNTKYEHAIMD